MLCACSPILFKCSQNAVCDTATSTENAEAEPQMAEAITQQPEKRPRLEIAVAQNMEVEGSASIPLAGMPELETQGVSCS